MKKLILSAAVCCLFFSVQAQDVEVWAGTGEPGESLPGVNRKSTKLYGPWGITQDGKGNTWITDAENHYIILIDKNDKYYTRAGSSSAPGYLDGTGAGSALVYYPRGIVAGQNDTIYIVDGGNGAIRKMHPMSNITQPQQMKTLAGGGPQSGGEQGQSGYKDGKDTAARFSDPHGIAIAKDGSLIVADRGNDVIRRVQLDGTVTTIAGKAGITGNTNGDALTVATFNGPQNIWINTNGAGSLGTIYVGESSGNIRVISMGNVSTMYTADEFRGIYGLTQLNNVWYFMEDCAMMRMEDDSAVVYAGNFEECDDAVGTELSEVRFNFPSDVMLISDTATPRHVLVVDQMNNRILKIAVTGAAVSIGEKQSNLAFKAYPNPSQHTLWVEMSNVRDGQGQIRLINMAGQEVIQQNINFRNNPKVPLEVSQLTSGLYTLQVFNSEGQTATQLVRIK